MQHITARVTQKMHDSAILRKCLHAWRLAGLSLLALPSFAFALNVGPSGVTNGALQIENLIIGTINYVLIPVIFALAFVVFIWGVFRYFVAGGSNPEAQAKGKQLIIYGIIGIAIMVSVWGLVYLVTDTVGLTGSSYSPPLPQIQP